ncbi:hypothetical protein BS297_27390 [Rhodococcus erythropolis]|uniref:Peptidase M20 dimerisation domain-containing protein n=1 Tax=Rhodococcus erythropolis TaxID=1833 RepID=A0A5N5DWA9_RHOER|nr:hypothetical protein BS297_27390 [Rhodococcus erythropolis]
MNAATEPAADLAHKVSSLLRWRTIWTDSPDIAEFEGFIADLRVQFPLVVARAEWERVHEYGLLVRMAGSAGVDGGATARATIILAHYDVVPTDGQPWTRDPFGGEIEAGRVWGRGALDDKGRLAAALEAAEQLLARGFTPEHDVYFSFGHDEEVIGDSARTASDLLHKRGIRPSIVLDEGSGIVADEFPGVKRRLALVSTAEKGASLVRIRSTGRGGHASTPSPGGAVSGLVDAVRTLQRRPSRPVLTAPIAALLTALASNSAGIRRLAYRAATRSPYIAQFALGRNDNERMALLRDTEAVTILRASKTANVVPVIADALVDQRLLPGSTMASGEQSIRRRIGDERFDVESLGGGDPSAMSQLAGEAYDRIRRAVEAVHSDVEIAPSLMVGATDARFFSRYSDVVYRFSPFAWSGTDRSTLHAADESVSVEMLDDARRFYEQILLGS